MDIYAKLETDYKRQLRFYELCEFKLKKGEENPHPTASILCSFRCSFERFEQQFEYVLDEWMLISGMHREPCQVNRAEIFADLFFREIND